VRIALVGVMLIMVILLAVAGASCGPRPFGCQPLGNFHPYFCTIPIALLDGCLQPLYSARPHSRDVASSDFLLLLAKRSSSAGHSIAESSPSAPFFNFRRCDSLALMVIGYGIFVLRYYRIWLLPRSERLSFDLP